MSGAWNHYGDMDGFHGWRGQQDEWGDDFAYYDENPDEDPFMPKTTCHKCLGDGFVLGSGGEHYTCPNCFGSGVER